MNLYKIGYNYGQHLFVVSTSFSGAETLWGNININYPIQSIKLVQKEIQVL